MSEIDDIISEVSHYYKSRKIKKSKGVDITIPSSEHTLVYNSSSEALEAIYFWILDFMNNMFGGKVEKLIDNFASSPGSAHFGDTAQRMSLLQQNATNTMQTLNTVLRSVMNILYDLKEFQIRLKHYDNANSSNKDKKLAGILALKQIWMDKVDIQRGAGSINGLATGSLEFVTLRDSFIMTNSSKDVDELDLNDRVKRILKPRIEEFYDWKKRSEQQLRTQFEIEKNYLKSQVNSLKLYARWVKPYLKAVQKLTQGDKLANKPDLVNVFNNIFLELTIMGKRGVDIGQAVVDKNLPENFKKMKKLRNYNSVVFIDFNFRGVPSRGQSQGFVFPGKADVIFKSYALNDDEIELLKDKLSNSDLEDSFNLIEGATTDSLEQLKIDVDEFLDDEKKEDKKETESSNPFSALFSFLKPEKKEKKTKETNIEKLKEKGVKKDTYAERYLRNVAEAEAINSCYSVFDIYKKAHGMASLPFVKDAEPKVPRTKAEEIFGLGKEGKE